MAQCTAPVNGHRSASGAENCPACRGGSRGYRSSFSYSPYRSPSYSSLGSSGSARSGGGSRAGGNTKPRWSKAGSTVVYTPVEVRTLTPVRENVEKRASIPDGVDGSCFNRRRNAP
jgi:hypothetical protein